MGFYVCCNFPAGIFSCSDQQDTAGRSVLAYLPLRVLRVQGDSGPASCQGSMVVSWSLCLRGAFCVCGRNELCFGCGIGFTVPCLRVQVQTPRSPLLSCCAPQGCTVFRVLPSQSRTASARGPGSTAMQRQCPHVGGRQVSHGSGLSPVSWGAQMLPAPLSTTFAHLSVPQSL